MIFCDYDSLTHYSAGEFSSKYKTDIHDALTLIEKDTNLDHDDVNSFLNADYNTYVTTKKVILYRVFGNFQFNKDKNVRGAGANGRFVSTEFAESIIDAKIRLALLPHWGNTRMYEEKILLAKNETINLGVVAPTTTLSNTILAGGADQIILKANWAQNPHTSILGIRLVTTHQLINPPEYLKDFKPIINGKDTLYNYPGAVACPYCGNSFAKKLNTTERIQVIGSKGNKYTMHYHCDNCGYYW